MNIAVLELLNWFEADSMRAALEILIFTGIFYVILKFLLETRGSGVIRGLTILVTIAAIASFVLINTLELTRFGYVFNNLLNLAVLGLVIIFQPEIRRAITHLGDNDMLAKLFGRFMKRDEEIMKQLLIALRNMSRGRVGAIIAIQQVASLTPYINRGTKLDTDVNHMMLETIFFPGNPLHDGAVIIQDDRIVAAGAVFPLSENEEISKRLGTRHRAALGLSEEGDAIVIAVSEETGAISIARQGRLHYDLKESELKAYLGLAVTEDEVSMEGQPA